MDQNSLALALAGRRRRMAAGLQMLEVTDRCGLPGPQRRVLGYLPEDVRAPDPRLGCLANRLRLAEHERAMTQVRTGHRLTVDGRQPVAIPSAEASRTTPPVDAIPDGDEGTKPEPWWQSA